MQSDKVFMKNKGGQGVPYMCGSIMNNYKNV